MFKFTLIAALVVAVAAPVTWLAIASTQPSAPTPALKPPQQAHLAGETAEDTAPACIGCGDARHPTPRLTQIEYKRLMAAYGSEDGEDAALDSLCYYGPQAAYMLETAGDCGVDTKKIERLKAELARDHVYFSVRVVDENNVERLTLSRSYTPFDANVHHHLSQIVNTPPCEISGTIKRIGLYHIWARF